MVREKYGVRLTAEQRDQLEHLVRAGKSTARVVTRARILLKTDQGWLAPRWPKPWTWLRAVPEGLAGRTMTKFLFNTINVLLGRLHGGRAGPVRRTL